MKACRLCFAFHYVQKLGRPRPHLPESIRAQRAGRFCMVCAARGTIMRCGGCRITPYCSVSCQGQDWRSHKVLCAKLRGPVEVFWIYEWQRPVVQSCQVYAEMNGRASLARFIACFGSTIEPLDNLVGETFGR